MSLSKAVNSFGRLVGTFGGKALTELYDSQAVEEKLRELLRPKTAFEKSIMHDQREMQKNVRFDHYMTMFYGRDTWAVIREKKYPQVSYYVTRYNDQQREKRAKQERDFLKRNKEFIRELAKSLD